MSPALVLPDGRTLVYETWGDPYGTPVVSLHGTPGSRMDRFPDDEAVAAVGARVITYDRPGYGGSDRMPGRRVVDCVADIEALADHLGIDRFLVQGGSGGGPHCLAVAAGLPHRVRRALCAVGIAPWGADGIDFFAGMDPLNVEEFSKALEGESVLVPWLEREAAAMRARVEVDPSTLLGDFELSEADRKALADPRRQQVIVETSTEMLRQGVGGWADDDLAFTAPWGFDPATVGVPVEIWFGETDVLVPPGHGRWLAAHVPGSEVHVESGEGHLGNVDKEVERLTAFMAAARP